MNEKLMGKVILEPEHTLMGIFQKERTNAISEMFDNVDKLGIYPTTKFFVRLDNCVRKLVAEAGKQEREGIIQMLEFYNLDKKVVAQDFVNVFILALKEGGKEADNGTGK